MKNKTKLYPPTLDDLETNILLQIEYHANQNYRLSKFVKHPRMSDDTKPIRISIPLKLDDGYFFSLEGVKKLLHLITLNLTDKQKRKLKKHHIMLLIYPVSLIDEEVLGLYIMSHKPLQDDLIETFVKNISHYSENINIKINNGLMDYIQDPIYSEDEVLAYDEYSGYVKRCVEVMPNLNVDELEYLILNGIFFLYYDDENFYSSGLEGIKYDDIRPLFAGKDDSYEMD